MKTSAFNSFWERLLKYDISKPLSANAIATLTKELSKIFGRQIDKKCEQWSKKALTSLSEAYRSYNKGGYKKNSPNLKGWRLNVLKGKFKRELKKRLKLNASLIAPYKNELKELVQKRFVGALSGGEIKVSELKSMLKLSHTLKSKDKKVSLTLKDQKMKMLSSFSKMTAEHYGAIGFEWSTRDDRLVVGTPGGEYPKVYNEHIHGNHYERDGKVYLYKKSWAVEKGLINKAAVNASEEVFWAEDLEDGEPGMPINCRCEALYIYGIEELADNYYLDILTQKGENIVELKRQGM